MRNVIRLGDSTFHGGKVVSVRVRAQHITVGGMAADRICGVCSCPINGHGNCKLAGGDPRHVIDGIAVAYEGHKTRCGATLIPTTGDFAGE